MTAADGSSSQQLELAERGESLVRLMARELAVQGQQPLERHDHAAVRVVDARQGRVEAQQEALGQDKGDRRPARRKILEVIERPMHTSEPFLGKASDDLDRGRGRVVDGLEQGFFVGGPIRRKSP